MTKGVHVYKNGKLLKFFTSELVEVTPYSLVFFDVPIKHKSDLTQQQFERGKIDLAYYGQLTFLHCIDSWLISITSGDDLIEIEIKYSEQAEPALVPAHN